MKNENEVCTLYMYEMQDLIKSKTSKPSWIWESWTVFRRCDKKNMVDKFIIKIVWIMDKTSNVYSAEIDEIDSVGTNLWL